MYADQLRVAVDKVVNTLAASGILMAIRDYRTAKGDELPIATARLGHAGAALMEKFGKVTPDEQATLQLLHLQGLRETRYWQELLDAKKSEQARSAELVHLYSRVLFASNHLPNFAALLNRVDSSVQAPTSAGPEVSALQHGESRLSIQLTDAGEKASDPDRIARSIDGIDMLYSACASLSRRPAMDLRLEHITGSDTRDIVFTGESDSVSAMATVIDSIPEALANLNDDQDIDLDELVDSLPIFDQLGTLAGRGAFSENDIKDIRETMHQGALLTLESGVVLPTSPVSATSSTATSSTHTEYASQNGAVPTDSGYVAGNGARQAPGEPQQSTEVGRDEHYERYLAERAAMQSSGGNGVVQPAPDDPFPILGNAVDMDSISAVEADKRDAVEELMKTLNRQRDG